MYNYINGRVTEINENYAVVEAGGIGYELIVSRYCMARLKLGEQTKIYTYMSVKEDGITLLGFYSSEEKAMFKRLISISGIGPKVAIGILSGLQLNDLSSAIASGDHKLLSGIKGIGKKTAERIVLELRDKLGEEYASDGTAGVVSQSSEDAVLALMALGYTKQESVNAVKYVDVEGKSVEEIVKAALKKGKSY